MSWIGFTLIYLKYVLFGFICTLSILFLFVEFIYLYLFIFFAIHTVPQQQALLAPSLIVSPEVLRGSPVVSTGGGVQAGCCGSGVENKHFFGLIGSLAHCE